MISSSREKHSQYIKQRAAEYGFDFCGIAKAERLVEEEEKLESWLSMGFHGKMEYMERHVEKRLDPTKLVPGAKSVISLLYNYYPAEDSAPSHRNSKYKVAKYAYGKDYHYIIKSKLKSFMSDIQEQIGAVEGRVFVDSAPVMERQWAARSGLGWLGKNTLLINKEKGSFFFIAVMIVDLELEYDGPIKDYCGTCTRCIDACPTDAIVDAEILNASKCISYLTIELKDAIPQEFKGKFESWVFGCDICQDVCPWNRFSSANKEADFSKTEGVKVLVDKGWTEFTEDVFSEIFKGSPIKRTKWKGLRRNIDFLK